MAILTKYPVSFTGSTGLPQITVAAPPAPAPSAGVDTYSYRFIANRSSLGVDTPIESLANEVTSGAPLVQSIIGSQPLLRRSGAEAWIDFDGANDSLKLATFAPTAGFTVAIVARVQSTAFATLVNLTNAGGTDMQMVSQPLAGSAKFDIRNNPTARLALSDTTKNPGDGNWHVLAGVFNGASSVVAFDGLSTAGAIGTGNANRFSLGDTNMGALGGVIPNYDVAEVIIWPTALTGAQLTGTVYPALKAAHPTLLP